MKTPLKPFLVAAFVLSGCGGPATDNASEAAKGLGAAPKEITADVIANLKDEELEEVIFENISASTAAATGDMATKISSMNSGQRAIYVTWIVEAEVRHGGFKNLYANSGELLSPFVKEAFETIGAVPYAELLVKANAIHASLKETNQKVNAETYLAPDYDYQELKASVLLDKLKIAYIRNHPEEFTTKK